MSNQRFLSSISTATIIAVVGLCCSEAALGKVGDLLATIKTPIQIIPDLVCVLPQ